MFSHLTLTNRHIMPFVTPPPLIHPFRSPVPADKCLNGSNPSLRITQVKNMAIFQETNPKTGVGCAWFHFAEDGFRSFFGYIHRTSNSAIHIRKDLRLQMFKTVELYSCRGRITFLSMAISLRMGTSGLWRYYSWERRGVLWNKGSNFVRNMPSSLAVQGVWGGKWKLFERVPCLYHSLIQGPRLPAGGWMCPLALWWWSQPS